MTTAESENPDVPAPSLVAAWWALGQLGIGRVPMWAAHWLADGYDGPALADVAGMAPTEVHEIGDLLPAVLQECGVTEPEVEGAIRDCRLSAARSMLDHVAELHSAGRVSERWVFDKVWEVFEDDPDPIGGAGPLSELCARHEPWGALRTGPAQALTDVVRTACAGQRRRPARG